MIYYCHFTKHPQTGEPTNGHLHETIEEAHWCLRTYCIDKMHGDTDDEFLEFWSKYSALTTEERNDFDKVSACRKNKKAIIRLP